MKPTSEFTQPRKPRVAMLIATGFGLGRLLLAPGTWGSLGGIVGVCLLAQLIPNCIAFHSPSWTQGIFFGHLVITSVLLAIVGIWSADRAAKYLAAKDPQTVVIDEVSGQLLTFFGGLPVGNVFYGLSMTKAAKVFAPTPVNWKYLALGFILFRVFDIWKPFPARQAERLPGGWGIMADDWVAGGYAAVGLWVARALGL